MKLLLICAVLCTVVLQTYAIRNLWADFWMKRDMKGLNTDDAEVAKAGFLAAVNADYRSCVSDIMTGKHAFIPEKLRPSACVTAQRMTLEADIFFKKKCDEALKSKSTWTSGGQVSELFWGKYEKDSDFKKDENGKVCQEVEEVVRTMIRKVMAKWGDWLMGEMKKTKAVFTKK